ncbi:hypothetical protein HG530_008725 [Fusarium avenaceum]|nr:hypothetical protein HG530_008725 [Fusarium avenaceum]
MLERSHHDFSDELLLDDRLLQYEWHQLAQVWMDQIRLSSSSCSEGGHCQSANVHVGVLEHSQQHLNENISQHAIQNFVALGKGVADSLDSHASDAERLILQKGLEQLVDEFAKWYCVYTDLQTGNENVRVESNKASHTFSADNLVVSIVRSLQQLIPNSGGVLSQLDPHRLASSDKQSSDYFTNNWGIASDTDILEKPLHESLTRPMLSDTADKIEKRLKDYAGKVLLEQL